MEETTVGIRAAAPCRVRPKATHHAVIQDDLYVCRDLCAGLQEALTHIPRDVPLCGYVGRVRPYRQLIDAAVERTAGRKVSWLTMHVLAWGPLVVVPVAAIPEMLAYCDTLKRLENYDLRLSRFWGLERRSLSGNGLAQGALTDPRWSPAGRE